MKSKEILVKFLPERHLYLISFLLLSLMLFFSSFADQKTITLRYKLEKGLYQAEKMRKVLFINLKAASPDDFKRVIQSYQNVVELASSKAEASLDKDLSDIAASAQLRIAELYLQQKEVDPAKSSLEEILRSYPNSISHNKTALFYLAQIYESENKKEKAVEIYHEILDNYPPVLKKDQPDLNLFALPHRLIQLFSPQEEKEQRDKEFEYAKAYFHRLIESHPNTSISFAATLSLAQAYQVQNLWKESIDILKTAVDSTGKIPGSVFIEMGNIYHLRLKDEESALSTFREVVNTSPDTSAKAEAQMKIGMIYFQKKDYARAKEELSKVKKYYPKEFSFISTSQFILAQIYEESGEWERALNEYTWLMINSPLSPEGLDAPLRIVAYYQKENKALVPEASEKGLKHYDELLNKYRDKPFAPLLESQKVRLYMLQADWDKAIPILQSISEKYAGTEAGLNALLNLLRIYKLGKKDERKSREILAKIGSQYPGIVLDTLSRR